MLGDKNIFIWALLVAIIVFCAYWHIKENKHLIKEWQSKFDSEQAHWLTHFAWSRTVQLLLALSCCTLIIIGYDWQLSEAKRGLIAAQQTATKQDQKIADLTTQQKQLEEARKPLPGPIANTSSEPRKNDMFPTAGNIFPSDTPTDSKPAVQPEVTVYKTGVQEVYDPDTQGPGNQVALDNLKKHYEEILVTYFFLKKCGKVNPLDYHIITSALSQEMASVNAPGRLQYDILTAAKGSYKEMYAATSCTDASVNALFEQYSTYVQSLSQNFSTP